MGNAYAGWLLYVVEKLGRGLPGLADFGFLRRKSATGYCKIGQSFARAG